MEDELHERVSRRSRLITRVSELNRARVHRWLKWGWIALTIPTVLWWSESIKFLVFVSVYAVVVGHWSSEEAAEAAVKVDELTEE